MYRMTKRAKRGIGIFLVAFSGLGMMGLIPGPDFIRANLLRASMPTNGTSQEAVIGRLNLLHIDYYGPDQERVIRIMMQNYTWGFVVGQGMQVKFWFTHGGKLEGSLIQRVGYGP